MSITLKKRNKKKLYGVERGEELNLHMALVPARPEKPPQYKFKKIIQLKRKDCAMTPLLKLQLT